MNNPASHKVQLYLGALALSGLATFAQAAAITGLKNTGADSVAGTQDLNYFLSASPGTAVITGGHGWEAAAIEGLWMPNNPTSQWLTPEQNGNASLDPTVAGLYTWELKFDLTGFDQTTASFSSRYRTDNAGTVSLNGTNLGADIIQPGNFSSAAAWKNFSGAAGSGLFMAGMNTLTFTVQNAPQSSGNPSGIRVEFLDSNAVAVVPEPEAIGLLFAGLGVVGLSYRRRRISSAS